MGEGTDNARHNRHNPGSLYGGRHTWPPIAGFPVGDVGRADHTERSLRRGRNGPRRSL